MTDRETVEEALEKLEAHITGYPQMPKVSAKRKLNVVRRALRDLRSALDSREDEGENVLHKPGCSFIVNGTCNKGCADEPEGDEALEQVSKETLWMHADRLAERLADVRGEEKDNER